MSAVVAPARKTPALASCCATPAKAKPAQRASAETQASAHPVQADRTVGLHNMTNKQRNALEGKMLHASALLELLVLNANVAQLDTEGMMGTLQRAERLLVKAHTEIMSIEGVLPDDLRWRTFEASSITTLAERYTSDSLWDQKAFTSTQLVSWFDSANACLLVALQALCTVEPCHE